MWISLAAKNAGKQIKTYEILDEKVKLAKQTFTKAGIESQIELIHGDFLENQSNIGKVAFCFIDCEKHLYEKCFDVIAPKMIAGGLIVADNAINHYESLQSMMEKAKADHRFDCLVVPIGKGEFVCRRK
jgi:predicted O-methyltransferase YrrM